MPAFSARSRKNLDSCDPRLAEVFDEVVKYFDCSVICGYRGQEEQEAVFHRGTSKILPKTGNQVIARFLTALTMK